MRIKDEHDPRVAAQGPVTVTRTPARARGGRPSDAGSGSEPAAYVKFSAATRDLAAMSQHSEIDVVKVARFRADVARGTLKIDAHAIAARIVGISDLE
ncbi:MAG: flagellar biosynthesis anti-sigma factor FlgM [Deltaproteobacteria bacterium]